MDSSLFNPFAIKFRPLPLIKEENDEVQFVNIDFYRLNQTNKSMKGIQKQKINYSLTHSY